MSAEERQKTASPGSASAGGDGSILLGGAGAEPGQDPLVGKRFGNCLLQRRIGAGAMGYVYLAHHVGLNKPVAIKIMSAELIGTVGNVQRFLREAQMAASLEHPNVVQVFDVGEANGLYYLAMQFVEGRSLDKLLESKGKLDVREANNIVKKIALALGAAHKLGIVHRDIKPANVLLSKDGQIKVADFGLARSNDSGQSLSLTGQIVGTPYYMSPEQAQGIPVDSRADLYSLGATWYHLVTGRRPFEGDTPISIILKHVNEECLPPDQVDPAVPPAVSQLIMKLLAKKPEDRFPTGEDVVRALVAVDAAAQAGGTSTSGGLAPAEKILELGGESMLDLFSPGAGSATRLAAPGPEAARILELGGESLLDMGPTPARPAPAAPPPPPKPETGRPTSVTISKDYKTSDNSPEGQLKAEGKPVVGKYLLLREIQKEDDDLSIWEAENVRTHARVALRLLTGHDSDRIRAFYKLAAEGTHLKHPNILHIIECHSDTDAKGRVTHFMAVEFVSGLPLEAVVSARMLPQKQLIQLCEQIAQALEFAHQKGKPNLTLSPREVQVEPPSRAIISYHNFGPSQKDEGRAKAEALDAAPFLAPEQVPNVEAAPDATTDVYRLGAILYWIVTGKPPFEASSLADYYKKILSVEPKSPKDLDPKVDAELDKIITTAMRKEKELRYAKAADLADALRKYLKTEAKEAPAAVTTRRIVKKTLKARIQIFLKTYRRGVILGGSAAAILIAGLVGLAVLRRRWAADALADELGRARLEALNRYSDGKYEEALSAAKRALGYFAGDQAMSNLAKTCQRRIHEASVLREAGLLEEAGGKGDEAAFLDRLTHLDRAVKALRSTMSPTPVADEASSLAAAGIGALGTGDLDDAVSLLEKAAALEWKDPAAGLALARAYFARLAQASAVARMMGSPGDRDPRSTEWLTKMVETMERPTQPAREGVESDLADLYAAAGRGELERVKALATSLLRRTPGPSASAEALAIRGWASNDDLADLDASIQARRTQSTAYVLRAQRLAERGRAADAAADLSVAAKLYPNQAIFPFLRSKARHSAGDLEGAMTDLTRVKLQVGRAWEYQAQLDLLERAIPERVTPPK